MTDIHDVAVTIRDYLDDNISDPISDRANQGKNWIYTDFPRLDSTLPRIGMAVVDNRYSPAWLGSSKRVKNQTLQISIVVKEEGNKFDINDDGEVEIEEKVVQYIGSEVERVLEENQDSIREDLCIRYALPVNSTTFRPEGENVIQKNIDVEVQFV